MKPLTISVSEVCQIVGIKRSFAFELMRSNEITRVKLRGKTLVTLASVEAMIERNSARPGEES